MDLTNRCAIVTGGATASGGRSPNGSRLRARGSSSPTSTERTRGEDRGADRWYRVRRRRRRPRQVTALVAAAVDAYGPVHVFCSNAGIAESGPGLASTPEQVEQIVGVNLLSHVWAAQQVVPSMLEAGEGYLVQTISSAALITGPSGMGYTLTKHGALGFAEWLALTYSHLGLTVTCLCPNTVNTGMLGRDEDDEERSQRSELSGRRQHR